jgi:hypothetical protein
VLTYFARDRKKDVLDRIKELRDGFGMMLSPAGKQQVS